MRDLAGKTAFVTGAASGIGFGIATALAQAGVKVMLCDIEEAALTKAAADLKLTNADVDGVKADVSLKGELQAAADATVARYGKIHILVNNAGVGGGNGLRRLLCGANIRIAATVDDVDVGFDELRGMLGKLVGVQAVPTLVDPQILPGDEALPFQLVEQGDVMRRAARTKMQAAEAIGPARLLGVRAERPRSRRAAEKSDKFASPHGSPQAEDRTLKHRRMRAVWCITANLAADDRDGCAP